MDTETRCKHMMVKAFCSYCTRGRPPQLQATDAPVERPKGDPFRRATLGGMWRMIGFLASRATITMNARSEELATECIEEYFDATSDSDVASVRVNETKWGHSIELDFVAVDSEVFAAGIPFDLLCEASRTRRDRVISNTALGWALFDLGFTLGSKQNTVRIRCNVPEESLPSFDKGLALGEK
ncbi:hypothetical protein LCGC14_2356540 [marine sediment metagenome]|uniref:Uncharacterized protein n=1 Tax=marine sediment metagenome TaxID=412755 RepID=A0A0F9EKE4_9ZZZZ